MCVPSQGHDLSAFTEAWWDSSHDQIIVDGDILFRKDGPARWSGGAALHVREQLQCIELC